jgi:hypothetical protein
MFRGWRNPICTLPFAEPVANTLALEFAEKGLGWRAQALRKAAFRELMLLANGQARLRVERVPDSVRSMLWVYTATKVGDAIMDLAPRLLVPRRVEIDLLIAPALAPLFATDRRLRQVHTDPNEPSPDVDFILLESLRTTALRLKAKCYRPLPFASMRGHNAGERFDRTAFADRRLRQLFGLPEEEVVTPTLDLGDSGGQVFEEERFRIAVPLGGRAARTRYAHWKETLRHIVSAWPGNVAPAQFRFFGQSESARKDLAAIGNDFVAAHGAAELGGGDLRETALDVAECDAFLGVEGNLMHIAIGVGTPGLALFAHIDPAYSLRPASTMRALRSAGEVSELEVAVVASTFLAAVPGFVHARRLEADL